MQNTVALLTVLLITSAASAAADQSNIVYMMADELGYYELSCLGNRNIQTPRLDQMARAGIRFTQALAGLSVCAPTRCCLMTGKHSGHTSVRSNGGGTPLRAGEETIASILKQAGMCASAFYLKSTAALGRRLRNLAWSVNDGPMSLRPRCSRQASRSNLGDSVA